MVFVGKGVANSMRKSVAIKKAEYDMVHQLSHKVDSVINANLRFEERRDPNEPVQLPRFNSLHNRNLFLNQVQKADAYTAMRQDSSWKAIQYGRFPKRDVQALIIEGNFSGDKALENFLEKDGLQFIKERISEIM